MHDVLAHLTGLCEDWVNHRLDRYASGQWTADQVSRHRRSTCGEILQAWGDTMRQFGTLGDPFLGLPPARWAFGDAVVHEADVRGALGAGRVPDDAVLLSLGDSMARWEQVLSRASGPTLRVQSPEGSSWWVGTRDDPNAILVDAPVYELFRGVGGRRSLDQVVAWNWAADPEPILSLGLPYPFRWASHALFD